MPEARLHDEAPSRSRFTAQDRPCCRSIRTLYQALQGFNDRAAQARITYPRLCFVGSANKIQYGKNWGNVLVSLACPIVRGRAQLEYLGWDVRVLDGLDHVQSMQATQVIPILRPWLASKVAPLPSA